MSQIGHFEKRIPEKVNQDGQRTTNCYRCGSEQKERNMISLDNRRKVDGWVRGDVLMICKQCHNGSGG